ncbi:MAG TPA: LptA/OstA family protein, partial [Acidobacteriota bacterium]|nr:LptA/OstA family protein [Acidobacteriota bacterium]
PGAGRLNNVHINDQALFSMTRRGNAPSMTLEADDIAAQFHERDGQASIGIIKAGGAVRWSLPNGPDRLETGGGVFSRSLSASVLEIIFSELEDSPESGKASGSVVITETLQSLRRSLEADAVHFRFFTKDSGIRDITAEGRVRIVQQEKDDSLQGPFTERFRTESDFLTAEFVPNENGSIVRSAAQWGNFRYRDDVRTASAGRLDYFAEKSLLALKGDPRIADKRSVTTGDYIEFDRKQNSLLVRGRVRSILEPQSGAGSFFHASDLSSPTVVTADELRYWTEIGKFRYSGGVQAVSEKQQLRAQRIDVYEHGERVEAEGGVRHLLFFSPSPSASSQMRPAPGAAVSPEPTIIQSDAMRYAQKNGELVYSGNVRLTAEEISLSSAELDVLSKPGGSAVTQAVARGKVVIRRDGFTSTGDTADWYPENGKLIVVGDPVEMNHPDRGRSYARRLTYFQADDRILLE